MSFLGFWKKSKSSTPDQSMKEGLVLSNEEDFHVSWEVWKLCEMPMTYLYGSTLQHQKAERDRYTTISKHRCKVQPELRMR